MREFKEGAGGNQFSSGASIQNMSREQMLRQMSHPKFDVTRPKSSRRMDLFREMPQTPQVKYAGFWVRFVAFAIDTFILFVFFAAACFAVTFFVTNSFSEFDSILSSIKLWLSVGLLVCLLVSCVYYVLMTYKYGATLGKKALKIKVVFDTFEDLSFGRVLLREVVGKFVSGISLGIGCIVAAFTKKKRALHDMIASTMVMHKSPNETPSIWVIVLTAIVIVVIVLGLLFGLVFLALNKDKEKVADAVSKAIVFSVVVEAIDFKFDKDSFEGYSISKSIRDAASNGKCGGDPIVNVSKDGKMIAAFLKMCSSKGMYFCADSVSNRVAEVDSSRIDRHYCSDDEPVVEGEKIEVKKIIDYLPGTDEFGLNVDVSKDVDLVNVASEIARGWHSNARLYVFSVITSQDLKEFRVVFKSATKPKKLFNVYLDTKGDVISSGEADDDLPGIDRRLDLGNLKISSSRVFEIGKEVAQKEGKNTGGYVTVLSLANLGDKSELVWEYSLLNPKNTEIVFDVFVDAISGEIEKKSDE